MTTATDTSREGDFMFLVIFAMLAGASLAIYILHERRQKQTLQRLLAQEAVRQEIEKIRHSTPDVTAQLRLIRNKYHISTGTAIMLRDRADG
jgi:carbonic anhydrase